jgi:hypothetical protein
MVPALPGKVAIASVFVAATLMVALLRIVLTIVPAVSVVYTDTVIVPERVESSQILNVQSPAGMLVALVYRGVQRYPGLLGLIPYDDEVVGWVVPVSTVGVDPDGAFAFS